MTLDLSASHLLGTSCILVTFMKRLLCAGGKPSLSPFCACMASLYQAPAVSRRQTLPCHPHKETQAGPRLHPAAGRGGVHARQSVPSGGRSMNGSGSPALAGAESCERLAASGHSLLIALHYNHSGRLGGRGTAVGGPVSLRALSVAAGALVALENVLVLAAIVSHMRSRRWVYYCLVNITLSDLLTGLAYVANVLLSGSRTFTLAPAHWFLREGLLLAALAASTFALLLTAAERCATMARPSGRGARGAGRVRGGIGLGWAVAAALGLLPLLGWNCVCAFPRCSSLLPLYSKAYVLFCVVLFALALAAILGLYAAILRVVRANGRQSPRPPARRKARRLLHTVLMMLAAFALCWGPLFGLLLADVFGSAVWAHESLRGLDWVLALAVLHSAVNPLIYSFRSREVRRAVLAFLCCACARAGLHGPGDCVGRAADLGSAASTDSSLHHTDSFRASRSLSFKMREPLSSVSSVRSV